MPPWPVDPWKHQLSEYEEHSDDPFRALLWQMRTGKSRSVLDVACRNAMAGRIDGMLVFAPNGPHGQWGRANRHLVHWWPGVPYVTHVWNSGAEHGRRDVKAAHDASLEACTAERNSFPILVVNTEALIVPRCQKAIARFMRKRRVLTVFDEMHDFRSPGSDRSRIGRGVIRKHSAMIRGLTGTPVANTPLAAWAQFELLSKDALGFENYGDFKSSFATFEAGYGGGGSRYPRLKEYINQDRLTALMADWATVVLRRDCEDLPPLVQSVRCVTMADEAQAMYDRIRKEAKIDFDGGRLDAIEAGKRYVKLQQALSGYVIDDKGAIHDLGNPAETPRVRALVEEVQGSDGKTIVWALFREEIRRLAVALRSAGVDFVEYHGGVKASHRDANQDRFLEDPTCRVFLGQPASGGVGLDLSSAETIINYSHTRNAIHRQQSIERATAMGGHSVSMVDFECAGTIDTFALEDHVTKEERAASVAGEGLQDWLAMLR